MKRCLVPCPSLHLNNKCVPALVWGLRLGYHVILQPKRCSSMKDDESRLIVGASFLFATVYVRVLVGACS